MTPDLDSLQDSMTEQRKSQDQTFSSIDGPFYCLLPTYEIPRTGSVPYDRAYDRAHPVVPKPLAG